MDKKTLNKKRSVNTEKLASSSGQPNFARPVEVIRPYSHGAMKSGSVRLSPLAIVSLGMVAGATVLAIARPKPMSANPPATNNTATHTSQSTDRSTAAGRTPVVVARQDTNAANADAEEGRRPLNFYTHEVRSNMFSAPVPPAPKEIAPVVAPVKTVKAPTVIVTTPPIDPLETALEDWSYTGSYTVDDGTGPKTTALIENLKTKDGQFVKPGDMFLGVQVSKVTDETVTLLSGKKEKRLAKSDKIVVTPLDKNAVVANAGQPGQPGQPQPVPPGMPGAQPAGPMIQVTMPDGSSRSMTQDQADRFNARRNRQFNGGGGGGGRRGGGGFGGFGGGGFGGAPNGG